MTVKNIIVALFISLFVAACGGGVSGTAHKTETVAVNPKTASLIRLGDSMARAGDYSSALGFYQNAHEEQRDVALPLIKQATVFLQMNDIKNAGRKFDEATQTEPYNTEVAITYARFLMDHEVKNAPQVLGQMAERFKTARFYNWYGVSHDLNGNHQEAQKAYSEGLALNSKDVSLLNNYGLSTAVTGKKDESYSAFKKAIAAEADTILYRRNLAIAQILNGDEDAARYGLQDVLPEHEVEALVKEYQGLLGKRKAVDILNMINHS